MADHSIWTALPIGFGGFVLYLAIVAGALRQSWARSPARIAVGSALLAYVGVVGSAALLGRGANFWLLSTFYWFPAMVFLMVFGAVYKSISLRILLDLLARPAYAELYSGLLVRYVETESFERRLEVMLENSFATLTPDGYALTDKGRRLARGVTALQRLFAIKQSG
jgi:hypothetical protein